MLVLFARRRHDAPFRHLFWLFGAFIILCGSTHLLEVIVTYCPIYWFSGGVKLVTALVSLATAAVLVPVIPRALAMQTPEQLERLVHARTQQLAGANAALRDEIARRERVEADLHRQREYLRTTLASIGDAVVVTDPDGRIRFLNDVAASLIGVPADAAHDRPIGELMRIEDEETAAPVENPVLAVLRTGKPQGLANHSTLVAADGRRVPIDDSASPIRDDDGATLGVVLVFRDVAARRAAERAVRDSEERFRRIVETAHEGIWLVDADGRTLFANDRMAALLGLTPDELATRPVAEFCFDDDLPIARDHLAANLDGHAQQFDFRFRRADGSELLVLASTSPIADPSGRVIAALGMFSDITERKRAEAALLDADRRKDDFLAMLGHELRNPLGPIRNAVEVLRLRGPADPLLEEARGMIDRQVGHMARLVDDLLDATRIGRGRILLRREPCDLAALLRRTAEDYRSVLEASGLRLDVHAPPNPVWVDGDPTRLAQMIGNLVHNAHKFTDPGGAVAVSLADEDAHAVVRVRDTGIGIEPDVLPRLFDVFAQADRSLDRSRGGLGLGLAVVRGLAELHGGSVSARSDGPGRGAEFTLRLPLGTPPSTPRHAPAPEAHPARRHILVIEDNPDAAESARLLLSLAGHDVAVAHDGAEGLQLARQLPPDVVLCDIGLPAGLSGYDVARALRADPRLASAFLIALTGYGRDEDQRHAREAGFDLHLTKPVDFDALRRALARIPPR
jgi:PAS domain S-box-containing protein